VQTVPTDSTEPTDSSITNDRRLSRRVRAIDASGIRRAFELGGSLERPINLSIGQPDFPVPTVMKDAAVDAIRADRNGYTVTQGIAPLHEAIRRHLAHDLGWNDADAFSTVVTGGTSGGLLLASLALLEEGDEAIIPDPWFVLYPQLGHLTGATMVPCDTYPDFRMTAARVEPLITDRTKFVLVNSPGNPSGVVLNENEVRELAELCRGRGVQIITDEIYDEFVFADAARPDGRCPSPARFDHDALVIRGFGKTYGCTGWRLGYAAGPTWLIEQMRKLQLEAFDIDNTAQVEIYARRREMVMDALSPHANVVRPGGAFYAFLEIPAALGMTGTEFMERAVQRRVLLVPGGVFSGRDTHVRLSFAVPETTLQEGLDVLVDMIQSG
jgi:aminotransferase